MADTIKNLYDTMSQHYDMTEDYDTFAKSMSGPDVRKRVYDAMSQYYEMDEWPVFDSTLANTTVPSNGNGTQSVRPQSQSSILAQNHDILAEEIDRRLGERLNPPVQEPTKPKSAMSLMAPAGAEGMSEQDQQMFEKGGLLQQYPGQLLKAATATGLSIDDLMDRVARQVAIPGQPLPKFSEETLAANKYAREEWKKKVNDFVGEPKDFGGYVGATAGQLTEFIGEMAAGGIVAKALAGKQILNLVSKIPSATPFGRAARYMANKALNDIPVFTAVEAARTEGGIDERSQAALHGLRMGLTFWALAAIPGGIVSVGSLARIPLGNYLLGTHPVETAKILNDPDIPKEEKLIRLFDTAVNTYFAKEGFTKKSIKDLHTEIAVSFAKEGAKVPPQILTSLDILTGRSEGLAREATKSYLMEQKAQPFLGDIEKERNAWLAENAEREAQGAAVQRMTGGTAEVMPVEQPFTKELTPEVEADLAKGELTQADIEAEATAIAKETGPEGAVLPAESNTYPLLSPEGMLEQVPFEQLPAMQQQVIRRYSGTQPATFPLIGANGRVSYVRFDQLPPAQQMMLAVYSLEPSQQKQLALPPGRGIDFLGTKAGPSMTPEQQADYLKFAQSYIPGSVPISLDFGRTEQPVAEPTKPETAKAVETTPESAISTSPSLYTEAIPESKGQGAIPTPVSEAGKETGAPEIIPEKAEVPVQEKAAEIVPKEGTIVPEKGTETQPVVSTYPSDFFFGISEDRAKELSGKDVPERDAGFKHFDKLNPDEQKSVVDWAEKRVDEQYDRFSTSKDQSDFILLGDYDSQLQALKNKMPPTAEPDIHVEKKPVELILPKSGNPFKTQQAAQRKANELGNNEYEVVSHKGGYAVRQRGVSMKADQAVRPAGGPGMEVSALEEAIKPLRSLYGVPIVVVESPHDLPEGRLRNAALNEGARGNVVSGLYDDTGTHNVYLISSGINDVREAIVVAHHEIVGHAGIEGLLGENGFSRFVDDLLRDKYISPLLKKRSQESGRSQQMEAREWFAEHAERENFDSLPVSLKDRVIFWFKQALRRLFGANRISFNDKEIEQLIRDSYKYARSTAKNEAISGSEGPAFRTQNIRVLKDQLSEVYKALRELPQVRYGQPTEVIQQRLVDKAQEIEDNILHIQTNVPFSTKPSADARLQKKIDAMAKGVPEKDKDSWIRMRMSTQIKREINALSKGHRLGQFDMQQAMLATKQLILDYGRRNLPRGTEATYQQNSALLTAVAKARTLEDVASAFDRIDDISRSVSMKQMRNKFDDLLTKYKPKTKEGKISGPSLMPDEYGMLDKVRGMVDLREEDVQSQLDDLYKKIDIQNDATVANRENVPDIDQKDQEAIYLLKTFGNIKDKDQKQMLGALTALEDIIKTGRTERMKENAERTEKVKKLNESGIALVSEGKGTLSQAQIAELGGLKEPGFFTDIAYESLRFENIFDELDRGEKTSRAYHGFFNRAFAPMINNSINAETRGVRENFLIISGKAQEIFGTTDSKEMVKMAEKMNLPEDTGITITQKGKTIHLVLSQEQAAKKWTEWQDLTLRDKFASMGWTQDTMDKLEAWITPQMKKWAEWQLYDWYPTYYHGANEVFREMYYVDLPYNPMYTPLSVVYEKGGDDYNDQMLRSNQNFFSRIHSKHLLSRTKNAREIKNTGLNQMLIAHMVEMEHFKAWATTIRDLRATFNNEEMRIAIKQNFGASMMSKIDDTINTMARGGLDSAKVGKWLNTLRGNFSVAVLGYNLTMIPKQLVSFPAYAADIPVTQWFKGLGSVMANPAEAVRTLKNSELMKARYGLGWDRDVMLNFQRAEAQMIGGRS